MFEATGAIYFLFLISNDFASSDILPSNVRGEGDAEMLYVAGGLSIHISS